MAIRWYGYAKCSTCAKAKKYLAERGIDSEMRPIRETPPTLAELKRMLGALDGNRHKLVNTSSKDYRESGLKDRIDDLSERALFDELRANGNLVKRPFLVTDDGATTGFKADAWDDLLG